MNVFALDLDSKSDLITSEKDEIMFSQASFEVKDGQVSIKLDEATTYLNRPGEPILPVVTKVFTFPFGTKILDVECKPGEIVETEIPGKLPLGPKPVPVVSLDKSMTDNNEQEEDNSFYTSSKLYPTCSYDYKVSSGLNEDNHVVFVAVYYYPIRYLALENKVFITKDVQIEISYEKSSSDKLSADEYDMVIIAPRSFSRYLEPLVDHKNSHGINTTLKTTESIYLDSLLGKYDACGRDKAEKIKYFIKYAIENWGIEYVLLAGGMKGQRYSWHVPVRYSNLHDLFANNIFIWETTMLSDLYYADIYDGDGKFDSWDSNGNGKFAEWIWGSENPTDVLDLSPDVKVGRLACRNIWEVKTVVDKIITYEDNTYDQPWFKRMIVVGGDSFCENVWEVEWNLTDIPDGAYTIYAQCHRENQSSSIVSVNVHVDKTSAKTRERRIRIIKKNIETSSTGLGIEITSPSEDTTVAGNTKIKGEAYDSTPPGHKVNVHLWIENSTSGIVDNTTFNVTSYFEGEIANRKALEYMPSSFENVTLWTSQGTLTGETDVINAMNNGSGFIFFEGHGNPLGWVTFPPLDSVNRVDGLIFMNQLENGDKLPICVVGGCHNSQYDVTLFNLLKNPLKSRYMGTYMPRCWSWRLIYQKNGGTIATIGNTGLGYGAEGDFDENNIPDGIEYYGGRIEMEFFKEYGNGRDILGDAHSQAIQNYINTFPCMGKWSEGSWVDCKTVQQWALLGDPSLKIGGYHIQVT
jgi:hypothetical protein